MNSFAKGLTFGAGFALGLFLVVVVGFVLVMVLPIHFMHGSPDSIVGKDAVEVLEHRLQFANGKPMVLGSIQNMTDTDLWNVIVEASLFSENGGFLNKDSEYFPHFPAGGKLGFKVDFYDWNPSDPVQGLECQVRTAQGFDKDVDS